MSTRQQQFTKPAAGFFLDASEFLSLPIKDIRAGTKKSASRSLGMSGGNTAFLDLYFPNAQSDKKLNEWIHVLNVDTGSKEAKDTTWRAFANTLPCYSVNSATSASLSSNYMSSKSASASSSFKSVSSGPHMKHPYSRMHKAVKTVYPDFGVEQQRQLAFEELGKDMVRKQQYVQNCGPPQDGVLKVTWKNASLIIFKKVPDESNAPPDMQRFYKDAEQVCITSYMYHCRRADGSGPSAPYFNYAWSHAEYVCMLVSECTDKSICNFVVLATSFLKTYDSSSSQFKEEFSLLPPSQGARDQSWPLTFDQKNIKPLPRNVLYIDIICSKWNAASYLLGLFCNKTHTPQTAWKDFVFGRNAASQPHYVLLRAIETVYTFYPLKYEFIKSIDNKDMYPIYSMNEDDIKKTIKRLISFVERNVDVNKIDVNKMDVKQMVEYVFGNETIDGELVWKNSFRFVHVTTQTQTRTRTRSTAKTTEAKIEQKHNIETTYNVYRLPDKTWKSIIAFRNKVDVELQRLEEILDNIYSTNPNPKNIPIERKLYTDIAGIVKKMFNENKVILKQQGFVHGDAPGNGWLYGRYVTS
jgi:hypothetical protein